MPVPPEPPLKLLMAFFTLLLKNFGGAGKYFLEARQIKKIAGAKRENRLLDAKMDGELERQRETDRQKLAAMQLETKKHDLANARELEEYKEVLASRDEDAIDAVFVVDEETQIQRRVDHQEHKRQRNIRAIVSQALDAAGSGQVRDDAIEPDPDWTARFFDHAKDVSNEDMQKIWAKLLAGEVLQPGRFSLRTLDVVRNLSRQEAQYFADLAPFVVMDKVVLYDGEMPPHPALPTLERVFRLQECGLLASELFLPLEFKAGTVMKWRFLDLIIKIESSQTVALSFDIHAYALSSASLELLNLFDTRANREYAQSIVDCLSQRGLTASAQQAR